MEGKCDICRKRDRDNFIKKHIERKKESEKRPVDETETKAEGSKETMREVKVEQDIELFEERMKLEEAIGRAKVVEKCKSSSPATKIKENDGRENDRAGMHDVEKQRTVKAGLAGIGGWTVKWVPVNSDAEAGVKTGSGIGTDTSKSEKNTQSQSSEFSQLTPEPYSNL
jgi:hypothetical protein